MKCCKCKMIIPDNADVCPRCGASQGFSPELIRRAKENDQEAIAELYNMTCSNVYYTIKAIVKDDDAVLDILQDSYLKAFRSLDQLQDSSSFRAWIKRIAHNRAVDHLRQTKAVNFSDISKDDTDIPLEFEDTRPEALPEVVIDQKETACLMAEILDSLPPDQRACVSMFYYEQMSVKEIAEELGVSENTVKSRLNYGRKKIETQVRVLEKKGIKLYGLAPIPFLLLLFKSQEAHAAEIPAASALQGISSGLAANAAGAGTGPAAKTTSSVAAKTATRTAGTAIKTKLIAGAAAAAVAAGGVVAYNHFSDQSAAVQEARQEQVLPDDFLVEMEGLAKQHIESLTEDYERLTFRMDGGEMDVEPAYLYIEDEMLQKDALLIETEGRCAFSIVYEADIHISDDWYGFEANPDVAHNYENAAIVFSLDTYPNIFLQDDGSLVYTKDDFGLYGVYRSMDDYRDAVKQIADFTECKITGIVLP